MSSKNDYFDYVVNVLGVKSVLLGQTEASTLQVVPLLICVEDYSEYSAEEKQLLEKMIAALKIESPLIKIVDLSEAHLFHSEFSLIFKDDPGQTETSNNLQVITYSPRYLVQNPQFKKNVWQDLQKIILYFSAKS